ncbi:MAG: glycosyltransferase family 2 protein [Myxococcota bacterium]
MPDILVLCKSDEVDAFVNEGVEIICDDKNGGYASRLNIARDYAIAKGYEYILFSNNDIVVDRMAIFRMHSFIKNHPYTIVGPVILKGNNLVESAGIRLNLITGRNFNLYNNSEFTSIGEEVILPDAVAGTFFMLKTEILKDLGFDEEYDYYFEDVSFCLQAKEKGIISVVLRDANIIHLGAQSIRRFSTQDIAEMVTRNHIRTVIKHSPLKDRPYRFIPLAFTILFNLLFFGIRAKKPLAALRGVTLGAIRGYGGRGK